jgi:23S rRNA (uridine2552-2'-O)-methyltransferase
MKKYRDHYFKRARQEGHPARSIYKLQEIDKRFSLLRSGDRVLDLGAAPGSWTLYAAQRVGGKGRVLAVDIQDIESAQGERTAPFPDNVTLLQADVLDVDGPLSQVLTEHGPFQAVLSDMAPRTSGVKFADQAKSLELGEMALDVAMQWLVPGGVFVVKLFMGPDVRQYVARMRTCFDAVRNFKPKSSRSESKETFYVAQGFTGGVATEDP